MATVHGQEKLDQRLVDTLVGALKHIASRIVLNRWPTGVAVAPPDTTGAPTRRQRYRFTPSGGVTRHDAICATSGAAKHDSRAMAKGRLGRVGLANDGVNTDRAD